MSFFDFLLGHPSEKRASLEGPQPLTSARLLELFTPGAVDAGVPVTTDSALGITAVFRAVSLRAGVGAGLPLHSYRKDENDNRIDTTGQHAVLQDPHPEMTPFELWELVFSHIDLWGNAYLLKRRNAQGRTISLEPIRPELVYVGRASDGFKVFEIRNAAKRLVLSTQEVLHIPGFGYDGTLGLSPIQVARQGLGLAIAAEKYGAKLFASGALMAGVLQTDRRLDRTQADTLKQRWKDLSHGMAHAHETAVLDMGAKFTQLSINPEDAQMLETRGFSVTEVARLFGVPPHLLMHLEKSTSWGTGIEEQTRSFIAYGLQSSLLRVGNRVTKELLPRGQYAEHITQGLLRGDTLRRYQAYGMGIRDGWIKRSEPRRWENLPVDDPELDKYMDPAASSGGGPITDTGGDAQKED